MTEQEQVDAVIALLEAVNANPHTLNDIARMPTPPKFYTEVSVSARYSGAPQRAARAGVSAWRVTTRAVADSERNAREMRRRTREALHYATVGDSTPVQLETEEEIGPDNDWWSGLTAWTYTT